jgi:hypothetical protein
MAQREDRARDVAIHPCGLAEALDGHSSRSLFDETPLGAGYDLGVGDQLA